MKRDFTVSLLTLAGVALGAPTTAPPNNNNNNTFDTTGVGFVVMSIAAILFGLLFTFRGKTVLRGALFFAGFLLLAMGVLALLRSTTQLESTNPTLLYLVAAGAGLLGGILMAALRRVGLFVAGMVDGAVLALYVMLWLPPSLVLEQMHLAVRIVILCVLALLGGMFSLVKKADQWITAFLGASATIGGIVVLLPAEFQQPWTQTVQGVFRDNADGASISASSDLVRGVFYLLMGVLPVLTLAGVLVQRRAKTERRKVVEEQHVQQQQQQQRQSQQALVVPVPGNRQ